ncbi:pentapeptide repeat-containing protein [Clavibacter sp. CT19]|uniref:pentapeptide repeat-containing protein n=1 Tax=unclassified Clavibacter TaxID=2626594 RepID=UPI0022EA7D93|nr:pentapeptide repeat-containing protein [Clavibacter sp. CT19]MDA3804467.1 pentapeptide repeat-containing protein [Clavibacter sp. CT19]
MAVNKAIRHASRTLATMPESPFGFTDSGKADFRGLAVFESIRYLTVEDTDMSYSTFKDGASLSQSEFSRCVFDGMDLRGTIVTRRFEATSFVGAKLNGIRPGEVYIDCDFTDASMDKAVAMGSKFVRCDFSQVKMTGAIFYHCTFDECRFDGAKLDYASFGGSDVLGEVDAAVFEGCLVDKMKINGEEVVGVEFDIDGYLRNHRA